MARKRYIRKRRGTSWTAESSLRANKARWDADRHRRDAEEPERLLELARHPTRLEGDPIATLEYRDLRSGEIHRWTVLLGDRRDRVKLRHPDGRTTLSHGWAWVCSQLRPYLAGTKAHKSRLDNPTALP